MSVNDPATATQEQAQTPAQEQPQGDGIAKATLTLPTAAEAKQSQVTTERRAQFQNLIPEDYKTKEWVQNIEKTEDPVSELFKKTENLQSMIGKQGAVIEVPPPEEYVFKTTEWAPEDKELGDFLTKTRSETVMKTMAKAFHDNKIPPEVSNKVAEAYEKALLAENKELIKAAIKAEAAQKELDVEFKDMGVKLYGAQYDTVINNGGALIKKAVEKRPQIKPYLDKLDNNALMVLSAALNDIHSEYVREGSYGGSGQTATAAPTITLDQNTAERRALYADPAYREPGHPRRAEVMAKLEANDRELHRLKGVPYKPKK